jgi:esterase/lipase
MELRKRRHVEFSAVRPALPGRDPTNDVLARTGIEDCFQVVLDAYDRLSEPPTVIGHSMGGLLTEATRSGAASIPSPPGVGIAMWPNGSHDASRR